MKIQNQPQLPVRINKNGFTYEKLMEGENVIMYAQWLLNSIESEPKLIIGYEVFYKKYRKARTLKGKFLPVSIRFPHDEAFGVWAWSFYSHSRAVKKFKSLEQVRVKNAS